MKALYDNQWKFKYDSAGDDFFSKTFFPLFNMLETGEEEEKALKISEWENKDFESFIKYHNFPDYLNAFNFTYHISKWEEKKEFFRELPLYKHQLFVGIHSDDSTIFGSPTLAKMMEVSKIFEKNDLRVKTIPEVIDYVKKLNIATENIEKVLYHSKPVMSDLGLLMKLMERTPATELKEANILRMTNVIVGDGSRRSMGDKLTKYFFLEDKNIRTTMQIVQVLEDLSAIKKRISHGSMLKILKNSEIPIELPLEWWLPLLK